MDWQGYILLAILAWTMAAFVREWLPIDLVALSTLALLLLFDLVTPEQAISGFSNPAVITVMMMFVLGAAIVESGLINELSRLIRRMAGASARRASIVLLVVTAILSGFVNNTATVAVLIPVAIDLAKQYGFSPSKILIPLSYASIFGGVCTLLGTSTNLLASALAAEHGLDPISIFEMTGVGLILATVGLTYSLTIGPRLLPSRAIISSLTRKYRVTPYLTEVRVPEGSPLVGRTVVEERLAERFEITVLEILRGTQKIAIDIRRTEILPEDLLIVRGPVEQILEMKRTYGLLLLTDLKLRDSDLTDHDNILIEIQISARSRLEGRTLREIDFRRLFGCFVLAINRQGELVQQKIADIPLRRWDQLLVFGTRARVDALADNEDFVMLEEVAVERGLKRGWWVAALAIPAIMVAAASGTRVVKAAVIGVVFLLVTRRISLPRAYRAINWTVIFLLAAIIPLGLAVEETGLAAIIGGWLASVGVQFGPTGMLVAFLVTTVCLTDVISNNAAAVLLVPVAIASAEILGVSARPYLMAITFAASMSFLTPVGYQTNTMVYGPGGYRFTDYLRAGLPLTITFIVLLTLLIPRVWGF